MSNRITDEMIADATNSKVKSSRNIISERLEEIVDVVDDFENLRFNIIDDWSLTEDGKYFIVEGDAEYRCDGESAGTYRIWVPVHLINATNEEVKKWYRQYYDQVTYRTKEKQTTDEMIQLDKRKTNLKLAIDHLHDPEWIKRITKRFEKKMESIINEKASREKDLLIIRSKKNSDFDELPDEFVRKDHFHMPVGDNDTKLIADTFISPAGDFLEEEE